MVTVTYDLETFDRCIAVPHKNDLDLGRSLALRFVDQQLPDRSAAVRAIFQQRGAYARFKDLLTAEGPCMPRSSMLLRSKLLP